MNRAATVASVIYRAADGKPLARIDRIEPGRDGRSKDFLPYLSDGSGSFKDKPGLEGMRLPLYRLPDVRRAAQAHGVVWMTEGEGKADRLAGLLRDVEGVATATTISGGANATITPQHIEAMRGAKSVVVLLDSDETGRENGIRRAQAIAAVVTDTSAVDLFPDRSDGSDVLDFFDEGRTMGDLLEYVSAHADDIIVRPTPYDPSRNGQSTGPLGTERGSDLDAVRAAIPRDVTPKKSWVSHTEAEIVGMNIPAPSFDVEGLLPKEDGPTLVFGPPEAGKSWLTMHLCRCLASGDLFLGRLAVNKYPEVVYINMDAGARTTQRRFQRLASGKAPLANYHLYCADEFDAAEMERIFEKHRGAFVVIDCLADFYHQDRSKEQAEGMRGFVRGLRGLYERNACNGIVLDHPHRPKDGAPGDYYGSIQKEASFRTMWLVQALPIEDKSTRSLKITCRKMNDGERFLPFVVKIVFSSAAITFTHEGELEPSGSSIAVTPDFQQVEALLVGIPHPGMAQAAISARLSWSKNRTLEAIKASTKIVASGGSKNRRYSLQDSSRKNDESNDESQTARKFTPIRPNIRHDSSFPLGCGTNDDESEADFEGSDPLLDSSPLRDESSDESLEAVPEGVIVWSDGSWHYGPEPEDDAP